MANKEIDFLELAKPFDEVEWKVQSVSKYKPMASCVAYIDARLVAERLDKIVGPENWQDEPFMINNLLFYKIGIWDGAKWVWKSDVGTESNYEKEKGLSSDAFKRAAVKWGIGRYLYDMPVEYVETNEKQTKDGKPYPIDDSGQRIWDLTDYINKRKNGNSAPKKRQTQPQPSPQQGNGQPAKSREMKILEKAEKFRKEFKSDKDRNWIAGAYETHFPIVEKEMSDLIRKEGKNRDDKLKLINFYAQLLKDTNSSDVATWLIFCSCFASKDVMGKVIFVNSIEQLTQQKDGWINSTYLNIRAKFVETLEKWSAELEAQSA